jgi:hypothetical protein
LPVLHENRNSRVRGVLSRPERKGNAERFRLRSLDACSLVLERPRHEVLDQALAGVLS